MFAIQLNNPDPVQYCTSPVLIADRLTIDVQGTPNIQGMKISFTDGFISGEDELVYTGSLMQSKPSSGTLLLTGSSNIQEYVDAIKSITYRNSKTIPTIGNRRITISLSDVDYLPDNQHFYRYVSSPGIKWSQAKTDAESMSYYGLKGYLATITSKVENDFIISRTKGVGYIGATDKSTEGEWRWVTGPEGLSNGGSGVLFWKGSGAQAKADPVNFGPVNGAYSNWDRLEPNNALQGSNYENYCHITVFPGDLANSYKWNDVEDKGGSGDWYPMGYIVEFGGMENSILTLTATVELQVNTFTFKTGAISPICEGESTTLNEPDNVPGPVTYSWTPIETLSSPSVPNPVATPKITTKYTVSGRRGTCRMSREFTVPVIPKPKVIFSIDSTTCYGYNLDVNYLGDAIPAISRFTWIFGGDTIADGTGRTTVNIPLGVNRSKRNLLLKIVQNGCFNKDSIQNIHVKPLLSPWSVNETLLCLPESFAFSVTNPDPLVRYDWNFGDGENGSGSNPFHKYKQPGFYTIFLAITNSQNCSNTAYVKDMVQAAPVPEARFTMSDSIVYNDKPTVNFLNGSSGATGYFWNFGDGLSSDETDPVHNYLVTGYRMATLKATSENNCVDSVSHQVLIAFDRIFPPSGFSPNAPDAIDRMFLLNSEGITSEGYDIKVFSRWSDLIFEAKDEIKGWDGKMKNGDWAPGGTYLWILSYFDFLGRKHRQAGAVTLVY
jgi:hypothetical protein